MIITNAFSLNMLGGAEHSTVEITRISTTYAADMLRADGVESAIGHADTAAVVSSHLDLDVPAVRSTLTLPTGSTIIVAQYSGPRLPEGVTALPEGASIVYYLVEVGE